MALANSVSRIAPFWKELTGVCLKENFQLDIPNEINTAAKYRYFLWKTDTELKFDHFLHRVLLELRHVPPSKMTLILEKIAEHLCVFHQNSEEDYQLVVEMLNICLVYTERLVRRENERRRQQQNETQ
jgi:hypothetical protein